METVTVYHVTTKDRVQKCLSEGLIPYKTTEANQLSLKLDAEMDRRRPDHIVRNGLARLRSSYAHINLENAVSFHNELWLQKYKKSLAYIAIDVNPSEVYVADIYLTPLERYYAPIYWASVQKLSSYLSKKLYGVEPTYLAPDPYTVKGDSLEFWKESTYIWPEILLPGGASSSSLKLLPEQIIDSMHN